MPEDATEPREERPASTNAEPTLSGAEKVFVRLSLWQTALSVVGVFIAVVALYAALTESEAVRRQTAAAVWPFVQVSTSDYDSGDTAGFTLSLVNAGVGPAKVQTLRMIIDGEPMRDWAAVVGYLGGALDDRVARSTVRGRVLSPDEQLDLIAVTDPGLARQLRAATANQENSIAYCYCSIFDECWLADSRRDALDPEPVEHCPDFGDATFQN